MDPTIQPVIMMPKANIQVRAAEHLEQADDEQQRHAHREADDE